MIDLKLFKAVFLEKSGTVLLGNRLLKFYLYKGQLVQGIFQLLIIKY